MDLHLKDKSAIITGGSKGIGAGVAMGLAAEGCDVTIIILVILVILVIIITSLSLVLVSSLSSLPLASPSSLSLLSS